MRRKGLSPALRRKTHAFRRGDAEPQRAWPLYLRRKNCRIHLVMTVAMKRKTNHSSRLDPTDEQRLKLAQTAGCSRYVYNCMLAIQNEVVRQDRQKGLLQCAGEAVTSVTTPPPKERWLPQQRSGHPPTLTLQGSVRAPRCFWPRSHRARQ